jgi:hypothetical protein
MGKDMGDALLRNPGLTSLTYRKEKDISKNSLKISLTGSPSHNYYLP